MIIERQFLLAIGRIIGVIEVEHHGSRRLGVTGDESVHEGRREPIEVFPVSLVFQARKGWGTGSSVGRLQGRPLHPKLKQRVLAETIGVMGVCISRSDLINTLREQVPQGMINIGGMPRIVDRCCEALSQTYLTVNPPE
jgi:hypothetical protein